MKGDMMRKVCFVLAAVLLSACASTEAVRLSQNEALIKASVDPECGSRQATGVAAKAAAIETLRAGYDRYIVVGAQSADNVQYVQQPGTYQTTNTVNRNAWGGNTVRSTTTYRPGPTVAHGSYDQDLRIQMFRDGDPAGQNAVSAREVLGPDWQKAVAEGASSMCF